MNTGDADAGHDDEEPVVSDLADPAEEAIPDGADDRPAPGGGRSTGRPSAGGGRLWRMTGLLGWVLLAISLVIGLTGGFDGLIRTGTQALQCATMRSTNAALAASASSPPMLDPASRAVSSQAVSQARAPLGPQLRGVAIVTSTLTATSVPIYPTRDGMSYPSDVAWSPDGKSLAILGQLATTNGMGGSSALVDIYDATTGELIQSIAPDALLLQVALQEPDTLRPVALAALCQKGSAGSAGSASGTTGPYTLSFSQVLWLPPYDRLAFPFYLTPAGGFNPISDAALRPSYAGLLDVYSDGSYPWAVVQQLPQGFFFHANSLRWDLTDRTMTVIQTPPSALGYHWSTDGILIADTPLDTHIPPPSATLTPVADPTDESFTVWQSGSVDYDTQALNSSSLQVITPGVFLWERGYPDRAAWSPDGRYIVDPVADFEARLQPDGVPAPDQAALSALGAAQLPVLPVRDAALQRLLAAMPAAANPAPPLQAVTLMPLGLAWRPDGRMLAAQPSTQYDGDSSVEQQVTLYDCVTGRELTTLAPSAPPEGVPPEKGFSLLRWSRDGTRLFDYDGVVQSGTIWEPGDVSR